MKERIKRKSLEIALVLALLSTIYYTGIGALTLSRTLLLIYNQYTFMDIINNIVIGFLDMLKASCLVTITVIIAAGLNKKG